jgi:hypothetical protein
MFSRGARIHAVIVAAAFIACSLAQAAHYGTLPAPSETSTTPSLSISSNLPACADGGPNCIGTAPDAQAYPVADGDRITLQWTNDAAVTYGVIRLGRLYLPLSEATGVAITPVTLQIELGKHATQVLVEYSGTSHHVPLTPNVWQPLRIYNPEERILYVRLDLPTADTRRN